MATIKDIARISGYSIGTVSRVINQKADVSDKARKVIEEVIKREHFQPNSNAQFLKQSKESSIAIYIKGMGNVFLENILERIQQELKKSGEEADVIFVDEAANEINLASKYEKDRNPKGFIFLGGSRENFEKGFEMITAPSVLVSCSAEGLPFKNLSSFYTDDYYAAQCVGDMLIDNGHKNIGILAGYFGFDAEGNAVVPRLKGTLDVLTANKVKFNVKKQYVESRFSMEDAYRAAGELIKKYPDMTALFAHSDIMAIGAIRALHDAGKRVPDDVSVIGYDGIELTQFMTPRLTTVRQDADTMAELSVYDLLYRIKYPMMSGKHQIVPLQIVEGESVRNLREK